MYQITKLKFQPNSVAKIGEPMNSNANTTNDTPVGSGSFVTQAGKQVIKITPSGTRYEEHTDEEGKYHRTDGPAILSQFIEEPDVYEETWYDHGNIHRDGDLPAVIESETKDFYRKEWWKNDKQHRDGGKPAVIVVQDGKVVKMEWWVNGKLHRDEEAGPAIIELEAKGHDKVRTEKDNQILIEWVPIPVWDMTWMRNGKKHRKNGSAYIRANPDGTIVEQKCYQAGRRKKDREVNLPTEVEKIWESVEIE